MNSLIPVELQQNSMVGQQRQQISELQLYTFPNPQSFLVWKIRFKNQVTRCWTRRREDCFCSEQDHPEFPIQEEGQSRGIESPQEGGFLRGRQIAFMIYDYFRVTGAHDTVSDYADLFSVTLKRYLFSGMRVTIVHKNQKTLPPRLLSQPYHEVEVC